MRQLEIGRERRTVSESEEIVRYLVGFHDAR
jgi:hypothetical protein